MNRRHVFGLAASAYTVLSMLAVVPASAQSVKDQVIGTWSVVSVVEEYTDGKKVSWDAKGMAMLDAGGRFILMLADVAARKKVDGNPADNPVGKMISYFGTYTISEADKMLTYKIVGASSPLWDGAEQKRVVTINGSSLVIKSAPIPSAQGPFVSVVTWKKN